MTNETPTHPDRLAAIRARVGWAMEARGMERHLALEVLPEDVRYLLDRVERLEAALRFYADAENWKPRNEGEWAWHRKREASPSGAASDAGTQARAALAPDAPHREPHAQEEDSAADGPWPLADVGR